MKTKAHFFAPLLILFAFLFIQAHPVIDKKGGDVLEIYVNGQLAVRQFLHNDRATKTLQLETLGKNDNIDVYYSHCGTTGKSRTILLKDGKNALLKEWKFPDVSSNRSAMRLRAKDLLATATPGANVYLYYAARELSSPVKLVRVGWESSKAVAKH